MDKCSPYAPAHMNFRRHVLPRFVGSCRRRFSQFSRRKARQWEQPPALRGRFKTHTRASTSGALFAVSNRCPLKHTRRPSLHRPTPKRRLQLEGAWSDPRAGFCVFSCRRQCFGGLILQRHLTKNTVGTGPYQLLVANSFTAFIVLT
jgi:hypothetical protein